MNARWGYWKCFLLKESIDIAGILDAQRKSENQCDTVIPGNENCRQKDVLRWDCPGCQRSGGVQEEPLWLKISKPKKVIWCLSPDQNSDDKCELEEEINEAAQEETIKITDDFSTTLPLIEVASRRPIY